MTTGFQPPKYPKRVLIAAVAVFFFLLFSNLFFQLKNQHFYRNTTEKSKELELLRQGMKQSQLVGELAARMSAYSGYVSWETAHFRNSKTLEGQLKNIRAILPNFPDIEGSEYKIELSSLDEKIF